MDTLYNMLINESNTGAEITGIFDFYDKAAVARETVISYLTKEEEMSEDAFTVMITSKTVNRLSFYRLDQLIESK